ncbi:MAG: sulfatase-like hydrolase/transferase [Rhodospirillales bacterium]
MTKAPPCCATGGCGAEAVALVAPDVIPHAVVADSLPWEALTPAEQAYSARTMEVYAAMVERMDFNVGRVVNWLKRNRVFEDTLILFLSDNGAEGAVMEALPIAGPMIAKFIAENFNNRLENLGRPDSFIWYGPRWAQAATAPSRLHKAYTTEGGIPVVAFAHHPALGRAGEIGHAFSTVMDVPPMLLELAGVEHPGQTWHSKKVAPLRGRSMLPYLEGKASEVHKPDYATGWELFGRRAIRQGDWKAVYIPVRHGATRNGSSTISPAIPAKSTICQPGTRMYCTRCSICGNATRTKPGVLPLPPPRPSNWIRPCSKHRSWRASPKPPNVPAWSRQNGLWGLRPRRAQQGFGVAVQGRTLALPPFLRGVKSRCRNNPGRSSSTAESFRHRPRTRPTASG